ncbi:MAG: hypothetical protein KatS3mg131_3376 [Candidatus Tectimicrobiota bacterium]|nr:MAG: hypothetical protein KatS3mg131_3376 [Candidatus Tectomicrobia bacterium]
MYAMAFTLRPTAGLTFRILPGSILDIATYPFVPPTALSGFLRRLAMMSAGLEFPNTGPNDENTPFYALPRQLVALGAYPLGACTRPPHRTYRKGPRDFGHNAFSTIYRGKTKGPENIQLHTWEYLLADAFIGYVVSEDCEELGRLTALKGYGAKLGKEGFAFVEGINGPFALEPIETQASPSVVVPADALFDKNPQVAADIFTLYSFVWRSTPAGQSQAPQRRRRAGRLEPVYSSNPFDQHPSPIVGYKPFVATLLKPGSRVTLDFWHHGEVFFPAVLIDVLQGEISDDN